MRLDLLKIGQLHVCAQARVVLKMQRGCPVQVSERARPRPAELVQVSFVQRHRPLQSLLAQGLLRVRALSPAEVTMRNAMLVMLAVAGVFAPRNEAVCPPDWQQLPDVLKCDAPGSSPLAGGHGDPNAVAPDPSAYCHLPT